MFPCSGKNEVHMHELATKYELGNVGDPAERLNDLIFAFKTGIVQRLTIKFRVII